MVSLEFQGRITRVLAFTLILVFGLGGLSSGATSSPPDWDRADAATVRLQPSVLLDVPTTVRQELERRGCAVPQSFSTKMPHNFIRGHFTASDQQDVVILCSKARVSSILVFRGGSAASVAELASRPDRTFLQVVAPGDVIGYSRALGVADPRYIRDHHERYGGPRPPLLDHDGIDDIFIGKVSVVWYWYGGRWLQLQGAN